MNALPSTRDFSPAMAGEIMETVLIKGDLKYLTPAQRVQYHDAVCAAAGLNPLFKPFAYIELNGKLTLYALKAATDQLRKVHGVSVTHLSETDRDGVHIVTIHVKDKHGRTDIARGAVAVANLKGDVLANALMKAETKAKRRATLSICGLGMLDETEVEDIPAAAKREAVAEDVHALTADNSDPGVNPPSLPPAASVRQRQKPGPKPKKPPRDLTEIDRRYEAEIAASAPRRAFDRHPLEDPEAERALAERACDFLTMEDEIDRVESIEALYQWSDDNRERVARYSDGELSGLRMKWQNKKASLQPHSLSQQAMAARGPRYARQAPPDDGLDIPQSLRRSPLPQVAAE